MKIPENFFKNWKVEKIGVVGPGIVGMPMAGMLAYKQIKIGTDNPAKVMVIQRNSRNSGWKVGAINSGESVIGGIEPDLNNIIYKAVQRNLLAATHDFQSVADADVILIAVQTDKKGMAPDYGPLMGALDSLGSALQNKPANKIPVIIFESTLAPSSMITVIKEKFEQYGLYEGKNILLGNSPNRVMPGRLVQRIRESDKLIAGLHPLTPKLIYRLYNHIVTEGTLFETNGLTAEIVKTLENAYRDVRIAFSSEIARYCDNHDLDFYSVRNQVNEMLSQSDNASSDPNAVPSGGLLIPTIGVGGHCLPKDGILLWWRAIENGIAIKNSIILKSREINNESPHNTIKLAEKKFGALNGKNISLLGTAYRFNSEDTRNSPALETARLLLEKNCAIKLHDPYVKTNDQNLIKYNLVDNFTNDLNAALTNVEYIFICTSHKLYVDQWREILRLAPNLKGITDGCNIYPSSLFKNSDIQYTGIGRGSKIPDKEFIHFVYASFLTVETGLANELKSLIDFFNRHYVKEDFNKVDYNEVQKLAASCSTGCLIKDPAPVKTLPAFKDFHTLLGKCAVYQDQK